jgi:hypothetical protein
MQKRVAVKRDNKLCETIIKLSEYHPDWKAKNILLELRKSFPNVPSIRAIQQLVSEKEKTKGDLTRKYTLEGNDPERPWNLGTLGHNHIFKEIIPILLYISMEENSALTVRQAKWINRLYPIISDNSNPLLGNSINVALYPFPNLRGWSKKMSGSIAWSWARLYADLERISEFKGEQEFNTTLLDNCLAYGSLLGLMVYLWESPDILTEIRDDITHGILSLSEQTFNGSTVDETKYPIVKWEEYVLSLHIIGKTDEWLNLNPNDRENYIIKLKNGRFDCFKEVLKHMRANRKINLDELPNPEDIFREIGFIDKLNRRRGGNERAHH